MNFKQHYATTYRPLTKKPQLSYTEHLFGPLYYACTHIVEAPILDQDHIENL